VAGEVGQASDSCIALRYPGGIPSIISRGSFWRCCSELKELILHTKLETTKSFAIESLVKTPKEGGVALAGAAYDASML